MAKEKHHKAALKEEYPMSKDTTELLFWISIFILAIANIIAAVAMIPILLYSSGLVLLILILMGFFLGYLFSLMMRIIGSLEKRHHLIAALILPSFAVMNLFLMLGAVSKINSYFGTEFKQDVPEIFFAYTIAYLAPYIWINVLKKKL